MELTAALRLSVPKYLRLDESLPAAMPSVFVAGAAGAAAQPDVVAAGAPPPPPSPPPFASYAMRGTTGEPELDGVLSAIRTKGWAVVEGVIPPEEVGAVREDMERVHRVHGRTDIPYILSYTQRFAPWLASEKLLRPMRAIFEGQHIRLRGNKGFVHPPRDTPSTNIAAHGTETDHLGTVGEILESGGLHADGPFIQSNAVRVAAPYPDCTMQMQTVWMLSDFTKANGGTKVATGTHLFQTNPTSRRTFDGAGARDFVERDVHEDLESLHGAGAVAQPHHIDSAEGKAGSVLLFDVSCVRAHPSPPAAHTRAQAACKWVATLECVSSALCLPVSLNCGSAAFRTGCGTGPARTTRIQTASAWSCVSCEPSCGSCWLSLLPG